MVVSPASGSAGICGVYGHGGRWQSTITLSQQQLARLALAVQVLRRPRVLATDEVRCCYTAVSMVTVRSLTVCSASLPVVRCCTRCAARTQWRC